MGKERRRQVNVRLEPYTDLLMHAVGSELSRIIGIELSHSDLFLLGLLALAEKHKIEKALSLEDMTGWMVVQEMEQVAGEFTKEELALVGRMLNREYDAHPQAVRVKLTQLFDL